MQTNKSFSIAEALGFAWDEFRKNPILWMVATAITGVLSGMWMDSNSSKTEQSEFTIDPAVKTYFENIDPALVTLLVIFGLIVVLAFVFVSTAIEMGYVKLTIDATRSKPLEFSTLLSFFKLGPVLHYVWLNIRFSLLIIFGFLMLIIPGIYWLVKYQFCLYLFLDKNINGGDAFKLSAQITEGHKWPLFGLMVLMVVTFMVAYNVSPFLLLGFMPIMYLATAYVYRKLASGIKSA